MSAKLGVPLDGFGRTLVMEGSPRGEAQRPLKSLPLMKTALSSSVLVIDVNGKEPRFVAGNSQEARASSQSCGGDGVSSQQPDHAQHSATTVTPSPSAVVSIHVARLLMVSPRNVV